MNPLKKLAGQTAIYGLSSIIGRLLNYLLVPLYTSVFVKPSEFGVVSELYAWVAFLIVLLTFGFETTYFRFLQQEKDKKAVFQNSFLFIIAINVCFFSIAMFFNQEIADKLLYPNHLEYIVLLLMIVCIDAISSLPLAKLRSEEKASKFAGIQFASIFINIGLNLLFMLILFNPKHPEEGVFFILIANLISSLVKPILLYHDFIHLKFKMQWALLIEMIRYAFPLLIGGFAGIINETLDRILLKQLLYDGGKTIEEATTQVGVYSAAYKLAMLVSIMLQAYRYAAEPFFFSQSKNENDTHTYVKLMNIFIAAVCFVFLLVSLNVSWLKVLFIRNESYWIGIGVVPILLLANVFLGIYYNQSIWYKLSGQTRYGAYIAIGGASLTILLNCIFIPIYGYWACAWTTFIVYAGQMIASYVIGQKKYPIPYNLKRFFSYLSLALTLFFICKNITLSSQTLTIIIHNLFIVAYLMIVWKIESPKKIRKQG